MDPECYCMPFNNASGVGTSTNYLLYNYIIHDLHLCNTHNIHNGLSLL